MKALVCIPIFNEEQTIGFVIDEIRKMFPEYDILAIDDCSTDNSADFCRGRENVSVIHLLFNMGIGGARQTGFKYACYYNYDVLIQLDGDGQHVPLYISDMLLEIKNGANICIGSRFINYEGFQSSFVRRLGSLLLRKLIRLIAKIEITDPTSGLRACDKKAIEIFANEYPIDYPEPESLVIAAKNNLKIKEIPVKMKARSKGKSSINRLDSVYYIIKVSIAILIYSFKKKESPKK